MPKPVLISHHVNHFGDGKQNSENLTATKQDHTLHSGFLDDSFHVFRSYDLSYLVQFF